MEKNDLEIKYWGYGTLTFEFKALTVIFRDVMNVNFLKSS